MWNIGLVIYKFYIFVMVCGVFICYIGYVEDRGGGNFEGF